MQEIKLWEIGADSTGKVVVQDVQPANQMETEHRAQSKKGEKNRAKAGDHNGRK
jgi:hypothetical protein